jgi:3-oxoacyl-[acyl-carrier-protein] synthase II
MTIFVQGIGWVTGEGYGGIAGGLRRQFMPGESAGSLARLGIFSHPFRNFGRLDGISKLTVSAVALALRDAGVDYAPTLRQDTGIIGTSSEGSLVSDGNYFRDYLDNGRTLSRGNLFIYTLPSSPLGEAAIHFGLVGPLLYVAGNKGSLAPVLEMAGEMLAAGETDRVLAGLAGDGEALYMLLGRENGGGTLCALDDAVAVAERKPGITDMVEELTILKGKKGAA